LFGLKAWIEEGFFPEGFFAGGAPALGPGTGLMVALQPDGCVCKGRRTAQQPRQVLVVAPTGGVSGAPTAADVADNELGPGGAPDEPLAEELQPGLAAGRTGARSRGSSGCGSGTHGDAPAALQRGAVSGSGGTAVPWSDDEDVSDHFKEHGLARVEAGLAAKEQAEGIAGGSSSGGGGGSGSGSGSGSQGGDLRLVADDGWRQGCSRGGEGGASVAAECAAEAAAGCSRVRVSTAGSALRVRRQADPLVMLGVAAFGDASRVGSGGELGSGDPSSSNGVHQGADGEAVQAPKEGAGPQVPEARRQQRKGRPVLQVGDYDTEDGGDEDQGVAHGGDGAALDQAAAKSIPFNGGTEQTLVTAAAMGGGPSVAGGGHAARRPQLTVLLLQPQQRPRRPLSVAVPGVGGNGGGSGEAQDQQEPLAGAAAGTARGAEPGTAAVGTASGVAEPAAAQGLGSGGGDSGAAAQEQMHLVPLCGQAEATGQLEPLQRFDSLPSVLQMELAPGAFPFQAGLDWGGGVVPCWPQSCFTVPPAGSHPW
jgi:hypothetical protein